MVELVDTLASGASARKGVEVQVLFWAPTKHDLMLLFRKAQRYRAEARGLPLANHYVLNPTL